MGRFAIPSEDSETELPTRGGGNTVSRRSPVSMFLDLMGEWKYSFPLTTQWTLAIEPEANQLGNSQGLFNIIGQYTQIDVSNFLIPPYIQSLLLGETTQPNLDGLGLYFAQSVTIPKESFSPTEAGIAGMGGYLRGAVGGDRLGIAERTFTTEFLETNLDFVDGLIRPWIIAASYKGLINMGKANSIKATITVREFTRQSGPDNMKPERKTHVFEGCVPIDVSDKTLKYDQEHVLINTVNWIFNKYTYKIDTDFTADPSSILG
jgi:hypothetical protein